MIFFSKQLSGHYLFAIAVFLFMAFLYSQYYFHFELKLHYFNIGIASLCLAFISIFFHCFCIVSNRSYSFPVTIASRRNEYDYLFITYLSC